MIIKAISYTLQIERRIWILRLEHEKREQGHDEQETGHEKTDPQQNYSPSGRRCLENQRFIDI